jgi:hypothetical protein
MAIVDLDFVDLVAYTDSQTTTQIIAYGATDWRSYSYVRAEPNKLYAVNENYRVKQGAATFSLQSQLNADYDPHVKAFVQALLLTATDEGQRSLIASSILVCNNNIIPGKKYFVDIDLAALGINWAPDTEYRFEFTDDFVRDQGVDDVETAAAGFTLDYTSNPPVAIESSDPSLPNNNVINNTFIEINFDRQIRSNFAGGNIYLYRDPDTLLKSYDIKTEVQFTERSIRFSTLGLLAAEETFYLLTDEGVIKDYDNLSFDITDENTFRFSTAQPDFPDLISFKFVDAQLVLDYIRYRNYSSDLNVSVDTDFIPSYFKGIVDEIYPVVADQQTDAVKTARTVKTFNVIADIIPAATYNASGQSSIAADTNQVSRFNYAPGGLRSSLFSNITLEPVIPKRTARITRTLNAVSTVNVGPVATYRPTPLLPARFNRLFNSDRGYDYPVNVIAGYYPVGEIVADGDKIVANTVVYSNTGQIIENMNIPGYLSGFLGPIDAQAMSGDKAVLLFENGNLPSQRTFTFYVVDVAVDREVIHTVTFPTFFYQKNPGWDFANLDGSIDIDDNLIVVGYLVESARFSPGNQVPVPTAMPSAEAFVYNAVTGQLVCQLQIPNATILDTQSGGSFFNVAISGNYAIVSYLQPTVGDRTYIFNATTGALIHTLNLHANRISLRTHNNNLVLMNLENGVIYRIDIASGQILNSFANPNGIEFPSNPDQPQALEWNTFLTDVDIADNKVVISTSHRSIGGGDDLAPNGFELYIPNIRIYTFNLSGQLLHTFLHPRRFNVSNNSSNYGQYTSNQSISNYRIAAVTNNTLVMQTETEMFVYDISREMSARSRLLSDSSLAADVLNIPAVRARMFADSSLVFDQDFALIRTLNNPNVFGTSANDQFGLSVAISGNLGIVGTPAEDSSSTDLSSGRAYIFNVDTGVRLFTLNNPNIESTANLDQFGLSVAISGGLAAVSSREPEAPPGFQEKGRVHIYNTTSGQLLRTIQNPFLQIDSSEFGQSISMSGSVLAVGDVSSAEQASVYIFTASTGTLIHRLQSPLPGVDIQFGVSVSIDGSYIAVGAPFADFSGNDNSGLVFIYQLSNGQLLRTIQNPNSFGQRSLDQFGRSVAVSGTRLVVGAPSEDSAGVDRSGVVYVFDLLTGNLISTLTNPIPAFEGRDNFGVKVAISGEVVLVAAPFDNINNPSTGAADAGRVHVFHAVTGELLQTIDAPEVDPNTSGSQDANFGFGIAISRSRALISARGKDDSNLDSGRAYVFRN